jgi:hypothetical protein
MAEGDAPPVGGDAADAGKSSFNSNGKATAGDTSGAKATKADEAFPWVALICVVAVSALAIGYIGGVMDDRIVRK